jgi:hypothetical protein
MEQLSMRLKRRSSAPPDIVYDFLANMEATYRHRYEIAATPGGSKVSYSMTQLTMSNPLLRLGLPVVKNLSWRFAIPFMAGRGFNDLLADAEQRARSGGLPREQPNRASAR